ncbi:Hypothetical protein CINCED_3A003420 [Cinara cedri]|uniref:HAT, C-terminal dimerisation domain n=1 Tax=Cinara cedri TaxID=506608 RepID=A0A5E4MND0_9HEMI|nr:Hypothetical protein CINCED_3A003420 [Cinara cedri]
MCGINLCKKKANILIWEENIQGIKKLSLWEAALKTPDLTIFSMLLNMVQEIECEEILQEPTYLQPFLWVKQPFQPLKESNSLSLAEKEQLIDLQCSDFLKATFEQDNSLTRFWVSVIEECPILFEKSMRILVPFATTYLCEIRFSALVSMKSKYHGRLEVSKELTVALSNISPRFTKLCDEKKHYPPITLKVAC